MEENRNLTLANFSSEPSRLKVIQVFLSQTKSVVRADERIPPLLQLLRSAKIPKQRLKLVLLGRSRKIADRKRALL